MTHALCRAVLVCLAAVLEARAETPRRRLRIKPVRLNLFTPCA